MPDGFLFPRIGLVVYAIAVALGHVVPKSRSGDSIAYLSNCSGSTTEIFAPCHQGPRLRWSRQVSAIAGIHLDDVQVGRTRCN